MNGSGDVFDRIRCHLTSGSKHWTFQGQDVCLKSWKVLHGIGFFDTLACMFFGFDAGALQFGCYVFGGLVFSVALGIGLIEPSPSVAT